MAMLKRLIAFLALGLWLGLSAAFAQDISTEDFQRWETLASGAEDTIDAQSGSNQNFEALRTKIAEYRVQFDKARDQNASRIATLREQLAALGPAPDGANAAPETSDVASNRADLNKQLNTLLVPVQRAETAFVRADNLVGEIDRILRDRQARELLRVSPSPLNPAHWRPALADLGRALEGLWTENPRAGQDRTWDELRATLPVAFLLFVLGAILILRGRRWSRIIVDKMRRLGARGLGIWGFVVSLLQVVLPFAGMFLLALAAISTQYFGNSGHEILISAAVLGGIMLGVRWVSDRVFSSNDEDALIALPREKRAELRFHVAVITVMIALGEITLLVLDTGSYADASKGVLTFIPMLVSAIALYRIGVILRGYEVVLNEGETTAEPRSSTFSRVVRWLGRGAVLVGVVSPLLLAAGYFMAADAILPPYILTLILLGLVMSLQRFASDVYAGVTGQGIKGREALWPVLFGLILLILVAPVLALVWGARLTDLTELWSAIGRGFSIGNNRISPTDFMVFAVIFVIGYGLTRLVQSALRNNVLPKTKIDVGGQNAIVSGLGYVGIFLAALAAVTGAGLDLSSLAIVAGALSVGIGFGLQTVVSNFVSGIILLIERPISEGDWIEVGGHMGYVRDISVRSTRIETFDRTDVIVPNADLVSGTVTNYTRGNTVGRLIVSVGVAYGSDTRHVEQVLRDIAEAQPMVLTTPPPNVLLVNFGADSLEFEIRCYLRDVNWMMSIKSDINHAIAARFAKEGFEIPFAQRDLWLRNPEALRSSSTAAEAPPTTTKPQEDPSS
ncbi:MAG: small-conductance mechanosensitive channel [Sulfitobacter sp.]|jgi:potassium-dependent mechanosensitive channel